MSKHTPGEWQKGEAGWCNIVSFDGFDIIGIAKVPNPFNINLIAAAPDLLEVCKKIINDERHDHGLLPIDIVASAMNAIRKAEGDE